MKNNATKHFFIVLILLLIAAAGYWAWSEFKVSDSASEVASARQAVSGVPEQEEVPRVKSKKVRSDYFFRLLRDPATNSIPENLRARELRHARSMPTLQQVNNSIKSKNPSFSGTEGFEWRLAGPPAVGGRTRALGIDQRNPDIIIAGGVSGGIWRSTDGGENWTLRTPNIDNFSVTSLAQDPTNADTWYFSTGEFPGNSASSPSTLYSGTGIFRSTDNGLTWSRIPGTEDFDAAVVSSQFDLTTRIRVSPTTGTIFLASTASGIYRSSNGNTYDDLTLGTLNEHLFTDVAVATDGTLVAALSSNPIGGGPSQGDPGIFISNDDGQSWTEITPSTFPENHGRSVITFAPSDPNIIYVFTQKIQDDTNQSVSFHMIDISGGLPGTSQDRSENLPDFGDPVGTVNTQGGYNMTISVKPDDPDLVTLGHWNLFRSFDGFATGPDGDTAEERDEFWIGGYAKANNVSQYDDQHPDQHVQIYDPTDPDRLWVGHDGGLSVTDDVEANDVSWTERNNGYIVTQFYDASIGLEEDDPRFMGGTQDNGTPFFEFRDEQDVGDVSADISLGDGGFSFFTPNFIFVSNQQVDGNNRVVRLNGDFTGSFAAVQPARAQTAFFINPYTVDPNDDTIMYYPGGSTLFRNTEIDEIDNQSSSGATQGWEDVSAAATPGFSISALSVTTIPSDILYYGASNPEQPPIVRRLDNASTSSEAPAEIDIPGAPAGAFIHDLAINPVNGSEVLVVMSNYNITGLYHTDDGGSSWTAVEGNLTGGELQNNLEFGPSLRSATIVPASDGTIYVLGTSTGVYATQSLDGDNTQWGRESPFDNDGNADIGFSVVENITSRFSDGDIAVGSHGRGIFVGRFQGEIADANIPIISLSPNEGRAGSEVTITANSFQFNSTPSENDVLFGSVRAEVVRVSSNQQLTVIVPRNTLNPREDDRTVAVTIDRETGVNPRAVSFTVLPPNDNALAQNFPNPFGTGDNLSIPISLRNSSNVTLQIYDTTGQLVITAERDEEFQAGTFNIPVDGFNNLASGVYIYRLIAEPQNGDDTFVDSQKLTFIR